MTDLDFRCLDMRTSVFTMFSFQNRHRCRHESDTTPRVQLQKRSHFSHSVNYISTWLHALDGTGLVRMCPFSVRGAKNREFSRNRLREETSGSRALAEPREARRWISPVHLPTCPCHGTLSASHSIVLTCCKARMPPATFPVGECMFTHGLT